MSPSRCQHSPNVDDYRHHYRMNLLKKQVATYFNLNCGETLGSPLTGKQGKSKARHKSIQVKNMNLRKENMHEGSLINAIFSRLI